MKKSWNPAAWKTIMRTKKMRTGGAAVMALTHKFLVPDYYPEFRCKGGECRCTCCNGWGISVSQQEYFRLLGMDCPPELRRRLDCAFHAPEDPSPERYRLLTPRWDGDCPLRAQDGLCALQCACGEEALPAVCRYYPRGVHIEFAYECSCTNSCEKVLEMLFDREEPLTVVTRELSFAFDPPKGRALRKPRGYYNAIRKMCADILHNRKIPVQDRIWLVRDALLEIEPMMEGGQGDMLGTLTRHSLCAEPAQLPQGDAAAALECVRALCDILAETSTSLGQYSEQASLALQDGAALVQAQTHFASLFPHWQRDFENMLLNHLFYECFPFSDAQENLRDEGLALCATYALVRYLTVGCMAGREERSVYVDAAAAAFRLIEHSKFDHNAAVILRGMGCDGEETLGGLLRL